MAFLKAEVERVLQAHRREQGGADRQFARRQHDPQLHAERRRRPGGEPCDARRQPGARHLGDQGLRERSEFSGLSPFLQQLNAPKNASGDEVTPGVKWLTIRSDNNDKYAQPDGLWIGAKGTPTNIGFDGPALKGATNVVLPRRRPPRDLVLAGRLRRRPGAS